MPTAEEDETSRASRTLLSHATTTPDDLYALLSLSPDTVPTPTDLKKAWRATALKHHPDKNPGDEEAAATRLDTARKAYDVLSDSAARAAYDDRVRAKREKQEREGRFEEKRRRMKEDLERRESGGGWMANGAGSPVAGGKRGRGMEETEAERREQEVRRLAADGARRRGEREEQMRRDREEEIEARLAGKRNKKRKPGDESTTTPIRSSANGAASTPSSSTPSFSFRKPGVGLGIGTPNGGGGGTPSLFEATMARLRAKEAEKRRVEGEGNMAEDDVNGAVGGTAAASTDAVG